MLKTAIFGPSPTHLILATLLLYLFGAEDGPKLRLLSDVPFVGFGYLRTLPSNSQFSALLVYFEPIVLGSGLQGWILAFFCLQGWILASRRFLG